MCNRNGISQEPKDYSSIQKYYHQAATLVKEYPVSVLYVIPWAMSLYSSPLSITLGSVLGATTGYLLGNKKFTIAEDDDKAFIHRYKAADLIEKTKKLAQDIGNPEYRSYLVTGIAAAALAQCYLPVGMAAGAGFLAGCAVKRICIQSTQPKDAKLAGLAIGSGTSFSGQKSPSRL